MNSVVIVAGGAGSRMMSETPKQFMEVNGKPVIVWTIEKFMAFDPEIRIVIVLPENHLFIWQDHMVKQYPFLAGFTVTTGGATRFHSVKEGLAHVARTGIVGIHDAVRPLVSNDTIQRCYESAGRFGSGIPVIDVEDSLRKISAAENEIFDRDSVKRVQTPQVFKAEKIITAYENCLEKNYTDDASVYESYFGEVRLTAGNQDNIKITFPSDMEVASALLRDH